MEPAPAPAPAPRQPGTKAAGSWQWARTAGTQRALLDAARAVFVEQGFADASIAEVVRRADSSVGSLYHHFGGKSELFIALWQEHQAAHEEAASTAVASASRSTLAFSSATNEVGRFRYRATPCASRSTSASSNGLRPLGET